MKIYWRILFYAKTLTVANQNLDDFIEMHFDENLILEQKVEKYFKFPKTYSATFLSLETDFLFVVDLLSTLEATCTLSPRVKEVLEFSIIVAKEQIKHPTVIWMNMESENA